MVPLTDAPAAHLDGRPVLILSGRQDPIVPADNADALAAMLAEVDHRILPVDHQLSQADVALARTWLAKAKQHATPPDELPLDHLQVSGRRRCRRLA